MTFFQDISMYFPRSIVWCSPFFLLLSIGCSPDDSGTGSRSSYSPTAGAAGSAAEDDRVYSEPAQDVGEYESFDTFNIPIEQTITVGSFEMKLTDAEVRPGKTPDLGPQVVFDFIGTNLDDKSKLPLANHTGEDLVLEIDGEYFYGFLSSGKEIPGMKVGENTFWWRIDDSDISIDAIKTGTVSIGSGSSNHVVIPLANPVETLTLNSIPLDDMVVENVQFGHRAEFDDSRIQFSSTPQNQLLDKDTARIVLAGKLYGGTKRSCVRKSTVSVTRLDGISNMAEQVKGGCVSAGEISDFEISLTIPTPIEDSYEVTIEDDAIRDGDEDVTFTIVIPSP